MSKAWGWILIGVGAISAATFGIIAAKKAASSSLRDALIDKMHALLGTPYIWGGKSPTPGLDCSGAVSYALMSTGAVPPSFGASHNADDLYRMAKPVAPADVKAGDLAFYGTPGHVSHVMMALGDGRTIGASGGGPTTTSVAIAEQQGAAVKVQPASYRTKDLVGFGRLPMVA